MRTHESLLQLLHPTGGSRGVRVLGAGAPGLATRSARGDDADVLLLAPRGDELAADDATATAASGAAREGALVLVAGSWRTRRRVGRDLREVGVAPLGTTFLFTGDGAVVSADRRALRRVAADAAGALRKAAASAAALLPRAAATVHPGAVDVYGRRGTVLAAWLGNEPGRRIASLMLVAGLRGDGGTVVVSGDVAGEGTLVAKVKLDEEGASAVEREARALATLDGAAREAGIVVSEVVGVLDAGEWRALVTRFIPGGPAARRPRDARETAEELARWLARWSTATREASGAATLLEPAVLQPLAMLEADLPPSYVALVRERVTAAGDGPTAAAHGDLTLWNVIRTPTGLAVVDWEEATPTALPLVDLPYLVVDAALCQSGTSDRAAAYAACFGARDPHDAWARRLLESTAGAAAVTSTWLDLATHACWLGHAADERRRGVRDGPFLAVLRRHAAGSA